jgi:uncharacterized membrane protein ArfC
MDQVNWWLIGLAFVLGMLLTFVLTIRRVKREVPVSSSTEAATPGGAAGDAVESETAKIKTAKTSTAEETATTKIPASGEAPTSKIETTGAAAAESKTEESESENSEDARGE